GIGNDIILGSSDTDFLYGAVGDDAIYGMDGKDYLKIKISYMVAMVLIKLLVGKGMMSLLAG
ncbi:hypothetical protein MXE31_16900, partial [Acinetobacter baumannii]|nr:hypothetical protein [Acinetobacter baumannii]